MDIAARTDRMAQRTRDLGDLEQKADFFSAAFKGAAAVATLFNPTSTAIPDMTGDPTRAGAFYYRNTDTASR
jgi:hypothetical protein